jgi:hypothetical protein
MQRGGVTLSHGIYGYAHEHMNDSTPDEQHKQLYIAGLCVIIWPKNVWLHCAARLQASCVHSFEQNPQHLG